MSSYTINGLTVKEISGRSFGAEVSGVDWKKVPLADDVIQTLTELQDKYGVIIFRNTGLDNDGQVAFCSQFGTLEQNPVWGGTNRVGSQFLFDISNVEADGSIVKKGTRRWAHAYGNSMFHTDSSFNQHRAKYSMLLAHEIPGVGKGNTSFADTRAAFQDLPEAEKEELRGVIVEHELWHSRRLAAPEFYTELLPEEKNAKPPSFHRLVQTAPNGSETLYIASHSKALFAANGEQLADSQKRIWKLIDHCAKPEYTFAAEWLQAGDMMWWDNRQSMHAASPYDEKMGRRDVRRACVYDDGPGAHGVEAEVIESLRA